jgi:hypothetical protein
MAMENYSNAAKVNDEGRREEEEEEGCGVS